MSWRLSLTVVIPGFNNYEVEMSELKELVGDYEWAVEKLNECVEMDSRLTEVMELTETVQLQEAKLGVALKSLNDTVQANLETAKKNVEERYKDVVVAMSGLLPKGAKIKNVTTEDTENTEDKE